MAQKSSQNAKKRGGEERKPTENQKVRPPPPPRVGKLETLQDVRAEMANVYRAARRGTLDPSAAGKLGYLLSQLSALVKDTDIEQRIAELERRNAI